MCNQFIQKIFPEYLVCTEIWDGYSRRDQDYSESNPCCFRNAGTACRALKIAHQEKGCNAQEQRSGATSATKKGSVKAPPRNGNYSVLWRNRPGTVLNCGHSTNSSCYFARKSLTFFVVSSTSLSPNIPECIRTPVPAVPEAVSALQNLASAWAQVQMGGHYLTTMGSERPQSK